jgi:glycosyltransferase involved in cell wall biosynthesis
MKILLFHGYMLRGTGSNIYNANLARALARLGHEVHLLCQDRDAGRLPWVSAVGGWEAGGLRVERLRESPGPGSVTVFVPDIHGLLPVYVKDPYEGFEVKAFPELTDAELDRYIEANVVAVRAVAAAAGGIDAALANHLVMGPAVLARAGVAPFAAKIHGSALEYTVKPHPRFLPYAREGMEAATCVLVGSRHTAESLWATLPEVAGLREKTRLGPPGVDTDEFSPDPKRLPRGRRRRGIPNTDRVSLGGPGGGGASCTFSARQSRTSTDATPKKLSGTPTRSPSPATGPAGLGGPALVVYVGKLIVSKGVDLLLAAWPLVHARHPEAQLEIAGFGEYEAGLRRLLAALERGDLDDARAVAEAGRGLEGGSAEPLPILSAFLADPPPGYVEAAKRIAGSVELIGRLEHHEVAELLLGAEALVMPSTFPESFGMVAAEAAACGALPISAGHSGMLEVSRQLAAALPAEVAKLTSFAVGEGAVEAIAERLDGWLALPEPERAAAREALVATARGLWSWEGVARGVIAASQGDFERLPLA